MIVAKGNLRTVEIVSINLKLISREHIWITTIAPDKAVGVQQTSKFAKPLKSALYEQTTLYRYSPSSLYV